MGGVVPKGKNNDELIDNLVEAKYITVKNVERAFRAVDRADFYPGDYLDEAYTDLAMRKKNLHMSAPCIYCQVMDNFELKQGHSFLNIGFGTGYLSTLVGLLLGNSSTNHGIDLYEDVLEYANSCVEKFIKYSDGFDYINFCKPHFVVGNIDAMDFSFRQYDRVYCGARIPNNSVLNELKKLVKEGGIMIYPIGESLMKYKRTSATTFEEKSLLRVQFSDLIPKQLDDTYCIQIYSQPKSLKSLCRHKILVAVTEEHLNLLDSLPIPNLLIRYLKYYRDPSVPKPAHEFKEREHPDDGVSFQVITMP